MIAPGALVMLSPIIVGFLFGVEALAGLLAGALVSGVQMAISASNTGGAWDNAKKYIAAGGLGKDKMKHTPQHDAAVIGDTVGDPLKDTSGPSLNILIKLVRVCCSCGCIAHTHSPCVLLFADGYHLGRARAGVPLAVQGWSAAAALRLNARPTNRAHVFSHNLRFFKLSLPFLIHPRALVLLFRCGQTCDTRGSCSSPRGRLPNHTRDSFGSWFWFEAFRSWRVVSPAF